MGVIDSCRFHVRRIRTDDGIGELKVRWVLWEKDESSETYVRRKGRYATKTAAEDAMKTLAQPNVKMLALPEDAEPQANKRVRS